MKNKAAILFSECAILIGLISFTGAIIEAGQSIGKGMYAVSVYEEYSTIFWFLILISGFCSITRVLIDIFLIKSGYRWLWGVFLLVGITAFILSFPIFMDYMFHGQYDTVIHYSYALEISEYGRPYTGDFYPASHVWASILASVTGLSVRETLLVLPVLLYLISGCNAFLFAWVISDRPEIRGLIVTMAVLPIFTFYQSMFYPLQMSIFYLWLFVALFLRTRTKGLNVKDSILLILVILLMPFIHPLGVLAAILLIITFFIFKLVKRDIGKRDNSIFFFQLDRVIAPLAILAVSWFTWFSSFRVFGVSLNRIYQSLFDELTGRSFVMRYTSVVDHAEGDVVEILRLIWFVHGPTVIWGILVIIAVALYIFYKGKINSISTFLIISITIFYGIGFISLAVDIIASFPQRYNNYASALVPFFVAPIFFHFFNHSKRIRRAFIIIILIITLTGAFGSGINNLFFSKIVRSSNHHFSLAQLQGYQFLIDFNSNSGKNIYSSRQQSREIFALEPYSDLINLIQTSPNWQVRKAPDHFGYLGETDSLGQRFYNPEYLIITDFDIGIHQVGSLQTRFSPKDFALLEFDGRWHKVYDSGDFSLRVWRED